jgi:hypothetical protein
MPSKDIIAGCEQVAKTTIDLLEWKQTPDVLADAVLETLIEMSAESRVNIWHKETGISVASLAALYSMYVTGAGYRRMRLYGEYEAGRLYRRRLKNK